MAEVTQILSQIELGDPEAPEQLLLLVYDELRKLAAIRLAQEKPGQTLQATALVHEAFLRLVGSPTASTWNSRGHFFAAAAEAMKRILVENARRKKRQKHGGDWKRIAHEPAEIAIICEVPEDDILALNDALEELSRIDRLKAEIVQLRFFAGLTNEQTAELLKISPTTAKRHWRYARAWLYRAIADSEN